MGVQSSWLGHNGGSFRGWRSLARTRQNSLLLSGGKLKASRLSGRRHTIVGVAVLACALVLSACGTSSAAVRPNTTEGAVRGGTVYLAGLGVAGITPNYIFPMMPEADFSGANVGMFQVLMYLPLYWYGDGGKPTINYEMSVGRPPVYTDNDTIVTIRLNHYRWSDGEPVDARDVVFWMNLLKANKKQWGAYVPGAFPDNIVSITSPNSNTVVFHLNRSYNPTWFTYNELSQITPLPIAWDRTSLAQPTPTPTMSHLPDTTVSGARRVYAFLNRQAALGVSTYATSPLWKIVDGPWRLLQLTTSGRATFVPNGKYVGPNRPRIAKFVELPFTSSSAEFSALQASSSKGGPANPSASVTIGFVPAHDASLRSSIASAGWHVSTKYLYGFYYMIPNMANPEVGPVLRQQYVRIALQELVDQPGDIRAFFSNNASPTYGPVPVEPRSPYLSPLEQRGIYHYSTAAAKKVLDAHGWRVVNGVETCERPGTTLRECGVGIPRGRRLVLNLLYASGMTGVDNSITDFISSARQIGVTIVGREVPGSEVLSDAAPCVKGVSCTWQMIDYGGWTYSPDFLPTGGEIFASGAGSNLGLYDNQVVDKLIDETHQAPASATKSAMFAYEDYIARQLPFIFTPTPGYIVASASNLHGFNYNPFFYIDPQKWYFSK